MVGLADVAKSKCSFYLLALSFELGTESSFFSLDRISRVDSLDGAGIIPAPFLLYWLDAVVSVTGFSTTERSRVSTPFNFPFAAQIADRLFSLHGFHSPGDCLQPYLSPVLV